MLTDSAPVEIDALAKAFTNVNSSNPLTPKFIFDRSSYPQLGDFRRFYKQLRFVISSVNQNSGDLAPNSPPPAQITAPTPMPIQTTPPPSANPVDPQYSASSGGDSKDEHFTNTLALEFATCAYECLEDALRLHSWYRETDYELVQLYCAQC